MTNKVYFYQNNPCTIIRDLSDEFAEVKLEHRFAENLEGSGFCTPCMAGGGDGSHPTHSCEEHQEVIDVVMEEVNEVFCIVEKRLLNEMPIESIKIQSLQDQVLAEAKKLDDTKSLHEEWRLSLKAKQEKEKALIASMDSLSLEIEASKSLREQAEKGLERLQKKYDSMAVNISNFYQKGKTISQKDYDDLLNRDKVLSALEDGGVNNWEWYSESLSKIGEGE